jgi:hypothetical protein
MRHTAVAAALGLLVTAEAFAAGDAVDRLSRVVPLGPGAAVYVDATIANVTITGSARTDLRVDVERHAPTRDALSRIPAVIDERPDGVHVTALQERNGRDPALKAVIAIAAPADAVIQAVRVFEGRVRLQNLRGACEVDLQRGPIEGVALAGRVRLDAALGSVDVRGAELTPGGMMRLRVFNGPLRVRLARPPANGRILALTFNGAIASDIPLTMKDRFGPRFGESTIGTGDPVLSMDVVKGDITLGVDGR